MRVIGRVLHFRVRVEAVAHRPFHVRLPGAQPHVADQHIVHALLRGGGTRAELIRSAAPATPAVSRPSVPRHRACALRVAPDHRHGDLFARLRAPPDIDGPVPLQHHVIGEKMAASSGRVAAACAVAATINAST